MDLALLLLGGSTLWLACRYLSFDDTRPLYNAWTYLVAIPIGLLAVDWLLRSIVSRFVERTLQLAFLLSMLVHLLMTMGAVNLMLFANSESDLPEALVSIQAAQEQPSSVPEYVHNSENLNAAKPDYMRPVETAEAEAAAKESTKQDIEHPSIVPKLAATPDAVLEPPTARMEKAKNEVKVAEIKSEKAKLEKPELASFERETPKPIDIPPSKDLAKSPHESRDDLAPTESESPKRETKSSVEVAQWKPMEPNPISSFEPKLELSKAPRRKPSKDFELPAIEDRKIELAKRDLTRESAARLPDSSSSRVPLLDLPNSLNGDIANQTAANSLDRPSDPGDSLKSIGNRELASTIGGSISSAALEGWAEAGASTIRPGGGSQPSRLPSRSLGSSTLEDVQISGTGNSPRKTEIGRNSAPTSHTAIPVPQGSISSMQDEQSQESSNGLAASEFGSEKRQTTNQKSGSQESLRELSAGLDDVQPIPDITHQSSRSLSASIPRRGTSIDLDLSLDLPGLPGPKKLPRLPSARPIPNAPAVPIPAPAFQQRIARNDGTADSTDLGEFGPATEAAIERGLEFLAKHQRSDGSWRLEDFGDNPRLHSHTAATALSLLAFQGAGYSHRQYHYAPVCKSALEYLLANQQPDGDLYIPTDEASNANARFYSHSIAALAICEAFGMTQDEALREPAQRAVKFMVKTQDPVGGGWRYQPGLESDTSVSGWFMMALKSAELAGLDVPKSTFDGIKSWLDKAQASPAERHLYRYNPLAVDNAATRHGLTPNPTMTGVGLLMRLYLGWRRDTPDMIRGADYLLEHVPEEGTLKNPKRDTYYWYYATQVLFHMGGDRWKRWNSQLHPMLIGSQQLEGDQMGSWNPAGPIPDRWGPFAGRLYVTTLNLLSLEVYYRHLPIYEETAR